MQLDEFEDYVYNDNHSILVAKKSGLVGVLDSEFNIIVPFKYESIFLVDFNTKRMVAQLDGKWLIIDENDNIIFTSTHNYDGHPERDVDNYDTSYCYVPYCDGYIEHHQDKVILTTKDDVKEFIVKADSAYCFSDDPIITLFCDGYINIENGEIQACKPMDENIVQETLFTIPTKGFDTLSAYEVDDILYAGEKPYSLFDQGLMIEELKANGITSIINLMQDHEYNTYNINLINDEFNVINFPILDNSVPSEDMICEIIYNINKNEKTYIHCNLGLGRTGVVVASYLHEKYGYKSRNLIKRIDELKLTSGLWDKKSPITKAQVEFVEGLK